jgi:drug/metabolite transporter (DMT)-like permease
MNDGPHGLRTQPNGGDNLGLGSSLPATCFPPATGLASSWDRDLIERVGRAIGAEAIEQGVDVVLGPGVNIKRSPLPARASILLSAAVGCLIAAYTVLDGLGARASGSAHAYANTLFLCTAVILFGIAAVARRGKLLELARPLWFRGLSAGVLSAAGYWIVIWAMGVAPLGLVAATRESSVAIAAMIGWLALRERVRWIPLLMVLVGVILTRVASV